MDNNVEGPRQNGSNKSSNILASTVAATKVYSTNIGIISNIGSSSANSSFWKNSGRLVPGRPSPKRGDDTHFISKGIDRVLVSPSGKGDGMVSTFRDYQQSVSDAWDTGDDEFCIMSGAAASAASANGEYALFYECLYFIKYILV